MVLYFKIIYNFERLEFHVKDKRKSSPVTGLKWSRVFQELKVPGFHDNSKEWW